MAATTQARGERRAPRDRLTPPHRRTGDAATTAPKPPPPRPRRGSLTLTVQPPPAPTCDSAPCRSASRTPPHCTLPPRRLPSRNHRYTAAHTARTPPAPPPTGTQPTGSPRTGTAPTGTPQPRITPTATRHPAHKHRYSTQGVPAAQTPWSSSGAAATAPNPRPQGATPRRPRGPPSHSPPGITPHLRLTASGWAGADGTPQLVTLQ